MNSVIHGQNIKVAVTNKVLLENISFQVNEGDYLCIVGPNGAGKSSLIKAIMGILPLSHGQLLINQHAITSYSQKQLAKQVSYVPQANGRTLPFTVKEFVAMARYPFHSAMSEWQPLDQQAVEQAFAITNTEQFADRQISTLSGGECQRVMIAAALCQQSPILLLDEPTSFLDPHHQVEVHKLIRELNQQHQITIIEVSHDINHASQHSKQILALKEGQSLWQGPASEFLEKDRLHSLYEQAFIFLNHPQTGAIIALPDEQL
ncbi:ABC transporter ATP-binding protein [Methylophaga sp. 41_12_T18]|nr:ABC transporter ATP-binding protein [Methylophaga sp. 41_12_T18]